MQQIVKEQESFEESADAHTLQFNHANKSNAIEIKTIKYGDIQVVKNLQVPTDTRYSFAVMTALENKYHEHSENSLLHVGKDGMSRTTLGELHAQLVFWLVFVLVGFVYFIFCKILCGVRDVKDDVLCCNCLAKIRRGIWLKGETYVEEEVVEEDSLEEVEL